MKRCYARVPGTTTVFQTVDPPSLHFGATGCVTAFCKVELVSPRDRVTDPATIASYRAGLRKIQRKEQFLLACRCLLPSVTGGLSCNKINKSSSIRRKPWAISKTSKWPRFCFDDSISSAHLTQRVSRRAGCERTECALGRTTGTESCSV
jgi:hypothetical protein